MDHGDVVHLVRDVERRLWEHDLAGFDPYDGLSGRRVPGFLRRTKRSRQLVVQLVKRSPIDLRHLLAVPRQVFAKEIALLLSGYASLALVHGVVDDGRTRCEALADVLLAKRLGPDADSWGYEFDVQTRWAFYPGGSPNIIVTSFAIHALLDAFAVLGDPRLLDAAKEAAHFIVETLLVDGPRPFVRYVPGSNALIHNANVLAAGALGRVAAAGGSVDLFGIASACASTTARMQDDRGMWPYGEGADLGWIDNFHTAYVLRGLSDVLNVTGNEAIGDALARGAEVYSREFFDVDGTPKYTPSSVFPVDVHSAASAIDVFSRLDTLRGREHADLILDWSVRHLYDGAGGFYFQKHRFWTDRRVYVRWGQAHMFSALASHLCVLAASSEEEAASS